MNNDQMKYARYPDTYYYGIRPMISSVVAEMDDMAVAYPSQEMYETMVDRVYDEAGRMYPEEFEASPIEANSNEQFFPPFRRRRLFRDLLGVLVLSELLDRRRHHYY